MDPQAIVIAAMVGYFLSKVLEWGKGSAWVGWLRPENTKLIQLLTALVSLGISAGFALSSGMPFDFHSAGVVLFNAFISWITAELTYHKVLKDGALIQIVESPPPPSFHKPF